MAAVAPDDEGFVLPPLRRDLRLAPAAPDTDGAPMWTLFDPLRNQYFHVHLQGLRLIRHWRGGATAGELAEEVTASGVPMAAREVVNMARFVVASNLIAASTPGDTARLSEQAARARTSWGHWLMHRYLFFRIPLVHPDAFLIRWLPVARALVSRPARWAFVVIGLIGLFLAARQWSELTATFLRFLSWEGIVWYALALVCVKSAHELGHAFVAKRYGCRVPTMGVAFLVMVPMLYTDATDTWRLTRDRDRLRVAVAGVATELAIAVLATFAWAVLPAGGLRQAAFFLATTSWVATVLINLSPFMRFDGYHVLSDIWGIRNLQPRSFALTRWRMREMLFGFGEPPPEAFSRRRQRGMIVYAVCCWTYRFFLFLGIALLVYHFAFKALGVVLFCIEIGFFIVRPVVNEMTEIGKRRWPRNKQLARTVFGLLVILAVLFVPWRGTLSLPAVLVAANHAEIHAPAPGRLARVAVAPGDQVHAGETLFVLDNPDLAEQIAEDEQRLSVVRARLARRAGSASDLADTGVLLRQRAELQARIAGAKQRRAQLVIKSPFAGTVVDREPLRAGQWVGTDTALAQLVARRGVRAYAYVSEQDLSRIHVGATARFIPGDGDHHRVDMRVAAIDTTGVNQLAYPILASTFGGPLPVSPQTGAADDTSGRTARDKLTLDEGVYRITLVADAPRTAPEWRIRGQAAVEGPAESIAGSLFRHAASVFIRESGF